MTPRNREHLRAIITESVERFGWWAVLHECTQVLRAAWSDDLVSGKGNGRRAQAAIKAAGHIEDARDAVKEVE